MSLDADSDDETSSLLLPSDEFTSTSTVLSSREESTESKWKPILMGQVASVFICLSGVTSTLLADYGFASPCLQNWLSYFFISIVFTTWLAVSPSVSQDEDFLSICKSRGWKYLLITISDVGGNYLVVLAYQYTSLTSVQLLDCFSIPTVLFLSIVFLKSRYGNFHYLGIFLCLLGVCCLVWADVLSGRTSEGTNPAIGDVMCLSGAFLYGLSNVCQEYFVKSFNPREFLGFIGFFGCFISGFQTLLIEDFSLLHWSWQSGLLVLSFALVQFGFYVIVAQLLVKSNAVAINLSILSADFYSILVGLFVFQYNFSILYFMSFLLVVGGVGIFSLRPIFSAVFQQQQRVSVAAQTATVTEDATSVN